MIQLIAFYLFATIVIASAAMVIFARNPVHSVMWLILAFFNAAGLMLLAGAEFIAMLLVIVYVGAVAVLFLFVVMMLDIDFAELRSGFMRYLPIGALIGFVLLAELVLIFGHWVIAPGISGLAAAPVPAEIAELTNTRALGGLIYTRYLFAFQAAGASATESRSSSRSFSSSNRSSTCRLYVTSSASTRMYEGVTLHRARTNASASVSASASGNVAWSAG